MGVREWWRRLAGHALVSRRVRQALEWPRPRGVAMGVIVGGEENRSTWAGRRVTAYLSICCVFEVVDLAPDRPWTEVRSELSDRAAGLVCRHEWKHAELRARKDRERSAADVG